MNNNTIWGADTFPRRFPSLNENITTDLLIIGAGISGISCAYELLEKALNITVVEQNSIYEGTSLHTTGKITYQHGFIYHNLIKKHGQKKAREYYEFNLGGIRRIEEIISKENINCNLQNVDGYLFALSPDESHSVGREFIAYGKLGIPGELTALNPQFTPFPTLKTTNQSCFNVAKYLRSVTDVLLKNDVRIYEGTGIINVEARDKPVATTTDNKKIIANNIIICTHYPVYKKFNFFFTKMIPYMSYAVAAEEKQSLIPVANYISAKAPTTAIRFAAVKQKSYIIISGRSHKVNNFENALNNINLLKDYGKKTFQIFDYPFSWCAEDYTSTDLLPLIGKLHDNIYTAAAYNKWGIAAAAAGALMIKNLIKKNDTVYTLFNPERVIFSCNACFYNLSMLKTFFKTRSIPKKNIITVKPETCFIFKKHNKRIGIYKDSGNKLHIVEATCPHMRCGLRFNNLAKTYDCKCHGSRFTYDGRLIDGPAKTNLRKISIDQLSQFLSDDISL